MTYQSSEHGYVFWNNILMLPMKKKTKDGKTRYFRKKILFEEASSYWEWDKDKGSIYYVKRGIGKRLARANVPSDWAPEAVMVHLHDRDISVDDCRKIEEPHRKVTYREACTNNWSVEFDGKNIMALVIVRPKMTYGEIRNIILNEGGTIDEDGTIHKGSACNKLYKI